eukprot:1539258-Pyramimonas_sp.AAC.1
MDDGPAADAVSTIRRCLLTDGFLLVKVPGLAPLTEEAYAASGGVHSTPSPEPNHLRRRRHMAHRVPPDKAALDATAALGATAASGATAVLLGPPKRGQQAEGVTRSIGSSKRNWRDVSRTSLQVSSFLVALTVPLSDGRSGVPRDAIGGEGAVSPLFRPVQIRRVRAPPGDTALPHRVGANGHDATERTRRDRTDMPRLNGHDAHMPHPQARLYRSAAPGLSRLLWGTSHRSLVRRPAASVRARRLVGATQGIFSPLCDWCPLRVYSLPP